MPCLVGIDVGLTFVRPTSGVCRAGPGSVLRVEHTFADRASRAAALRVEDVPIDVLAVDAPVMPRGALRYEPRACERVLARSPFHARCKPGATHVEGTARALQRAGVDTAAQWAPQVRGAAPVQLPRALRGKNVIEAFPNGFCGVILPDAAFAVPVPRAGKFDALYEAATRARLWARAARLAGAPGASLAGALAAERHHDRRAALVCALTAACVWAGRYVAVGDDEGGWIFLPPWALWAPWARAGLDRNRGAARVDVWLDGARIPPGAPLPGATVRAARRA
jgi:hypothetical protein